MTTPRKNHYAALLAVLIAAWFAAVIAASARSVFATGQLATPVAAFSPVVIFLIWLALSRSFRDYVFSLNVRVLTALQSWRIIGFAFVLGGAYGILPKAFATPAGWGDVAIGLTAPIAATYLASPGHRRSFTAWQILGVFDLVLAVVLGVLASPPVHILGNGITTSALGVLPLSTIPIFGVPLVLIFHIICLAQANAARTASPAR